MDRQGDRERESKRERDRQTDRHREKETDRHGDRDRDTHRESTDLSYLEPTTILLWPHQSPIHISVDLGETRGPNPGLCWNRWEMGPNDDTTPANTSARSHRTIMAAESASVPVSYVRLVLPRSWWHRIQPPAGLLFYLHSLAQNPKMYCNYHYTRRHIAPCSLYNTDLATNNSFCLGNQVLLLRIVQPRHFSLASWLVQVQACQMITAVCMPRVLNNSAF